jgi:hypothetical protein
MGLFPGNVMKAGSLFWLNPGLILHCVLVSESGRGRLGSIGSGEERRGPWEVDGEGEMTLGTASPARKARKGCGHIWLHSLRFHLCAPPPLHAKPSGMCCPSTVSQLCPY